MFDYKARVLPKELYPGDIYAKIVREQISESRQFRVDSLFNSVKDRQKGDVMIGQLETPDWSENSVAKDFQSKGDRSEADCEAGEHRGAGE